MPSQACKSRDGLRGRKAAGLFCCLKQTKVSECRAQTEEANGQLQGYSFEQGDALVFVSHKYHWSLLYIYTIYLFQSIKFFFSN